MTNSKTRFMKPCSTKPLYRVPVPLFLSFFLFATLLLSGCDEDDHKHDHEGELITTLTLTFQETDAGGVPVPGAAPLAFTWRDLDGEGSNLPVIQNITLKAQSKYRLSVTVLDEANNEDISAEIEAEKEEHQFFFISSGVNIAVAYNDQDANSRPVGLVNNVTTNAAGQGTFRVVLRHELDKNASGVSAGDIANAGGESDIDASFPVTVSQ